MPKQQYRNSYDMTDIFQTIMLIQTSIFDKSEISPKLPILNRM